MDEEKNLQEKNRQKDEKRPARNPNTTMGFRMIAVLFVLYMLFQVIQGYIQGGPDAPSLGLLITAIIILGGGSVLIGIMSYKTWKAETEKKSEAAQDTSEEAAEADTVSEEDMSEAGTEDVPEETSRV